MTGPRRRAIGKNVPPPRVRGRFKPPRLHGPLASPSDLRAVIARTDFLIRDHGHLFDSATPTETTDALFPGWECCGLRVSAAPESRHVYVWRRGAQWVGFDFCAREPDPPPPPRSPNLQAALDYLSLMKEAHMGSTPKWDTLTGTDRLRRVRDGFITNRAIITVGPVEFLADVTSRHETGVSMGYNVESYRQTANIVMVEDLPDPDGQLASARILAALTNSDITEAQPTKGA